MWQKVNLRVSLRDERLSPRNLKYMRAFADALGAGRICASGACTNNLVPQRGIDRKTAGGRRQSLVCIRHRRTRLEPERFGSPDAGVQIEMTYDAGYRHNLSGHGRSDEMDHGMLPALLASIATFVW